MTVKQNLYAERKGSEDGWFIVESFVCEVAIMAIIQKTIVS